MEPMLVPAEPVHEPMDVRSLMRQKVFTNVAAVGGLTELCDLAHKMQPDMVPADATVTEDTVVALLRAVVALTLVPPPMQAAPPPEIPSPTQPVPQPVLQSSPRHGRRDRMMRTPTFNSLLDGRQELDAETVDMAVGISAAVAASRARAGAHLAGQIE